MEGVADAYIHYLKLDREQPGINYLQRLIQNHLSYIPYETFSKFHYFQDGNYIPSFETFVRNLWEKGWGGTCFTLNINFARLLKALGFECSLVRVVPGHIALMVLLNGKKLYVDVGYGSPIMKPVELEAKRQHILHGFGEDIIFTQAAVGRFEVDRRSNGKSFVKKTIEWVPLSEENINQDIQASYNDDKTNETMRRVTAVRFNGRECYYLRDTSLKIMNYRNIREVQMKDFTRWKNVIQEVYQIEEESLAETVEFLQQRGVGLFGNQTGSAFTAAHRNGGRGKS
ncbi:arylamine N-acetyltransferase [Heyndrickxia acidiproducens]|uniref:arylamine N-acetyltransferase n=1 Tax=Heyndrickxia acidiproducens TaxID=1121084 RepID=UPI000367B9E8|nr:arylamine N-acetyltransferase [Heyndrickxia acidiproducens]